MKILIVDDEKNILKLYKTEFEEEGYTVVTATSGTEALALFEKEPPDIVTLDIHMPDINGIEVLRRMKEKNREIPVVMLTAYDYKDEFGVWSSDAYVVKSYDPKELKAIVRRLLETRVQ